VVNASSGIQPQTSEHLLLCSIFCPNRVVIVLNKIDLVEKDEIPGITKRVRKALGALGISESSPVEPVRGRTTYYLACRKSDAWRSHLGLEAYQLP
ncbi:hypothetical protein COOONC_19010, partial [Cooperia oncophora]